MKNQVTIVTGGAAGIGGAITADLARRACRRSERHCRTATLNFTTGADPALAKSDGTVVDFGSGAALKRLQNQASYAAARKVIRGLRCVAANESAHDGMRVNVICPLARTQGVAHRFNNATVNPLDHERGKADAVQSKGSNK